MSFYWRVSLATVLSCPPSLHAQIRPVVRSGAAPVPQTTTHLPAQSLTRTFAQIQIPPGALVFVPLVVCCVAYHFMARAGALPGSVLKAKINGRSVDVQVTADTAQPQPLALATDACVVSQVPAGAVAGTFLRFPIPSSVMQPVGWERAVSATIAHYSLHVNLCRHQFKTP